MKFYDLSQPLGTDTQFWPFYPPFEAKYFKRKIEHGVNAQIITTSNHIGTHIDAPRHFITDGMSIDQIPLEWVIGPGVIVDLTDIIDDLAVYTPEMIEERAEVREGDILVLHTGWYKYAAGGTEPDEERYIFRHPGAHPDMVEWLKKKKIRLWCVDAVSTDHPMDLPIGRFLGKGTFNTCDKVRKLCDEKFGKEEVDRLFPEEDYQLTHNKLFCHNIIHAENLGGDIGKPELKNKRCIISCLPWKFKGGEAAFARAIAIVED